jgi:hypothetical protein
MSMALTPLRPREFFGRPWSGRGEVRPRVGRRRPFSFRSECEFDNDTRWVVRDRTSFDDGETSSRTMRAFLVERTRIELEADDMPEGAEVTLEPRGFRFRPYRLVVPVGRIALRLRFRDRCWLDEDDVLHDEIELSWLCIPVGRIEMHLVAEAEP